MSRARKVARPARAQKSSRKPSVAVAVAAPELEEDGQAGECAEPEATEVMIAPADAPSAVAPGSPRAGLKLEASCTLRDSIDMQFQLLAVDFGDSDVLVDGSAVERIDTAGLQMLLSFTRHQATRGKSVKWTAVSTELSRGSQLLGLDALLGLPDTTCGSEHRGN